LSDELEIRQQTAIVQQQADSVQVVTAEDYRRAGEQVKSWKELRKKVTEFFSPMKKAADQAKAEILNREKAMLQPVEHAISTIASRMTAWSEEQRRQADLERLRLLEAQRKQEEDARVEKAAALESAGMQEEANELLDTPAPPSPQVIVPTAVVPKVEDQHERVTWTAEVQDFKLFVAYVAEHPEYLACLAPVQPKLNALARAQRDALSLPGIVPRKHVGIV